MTAEVINLRQFKRDKARGDQDRQAQVNRAAFNPCSNSALNFNGSGMA